MQKQQNNALYKWIALFVVVIGTFMSVLDSSIVNIAMPKLMSVFQVSADDAKWILMAYTLTLGAIIPLTGYLGAVFGNKNVYIFSLAVFTLGSFLCGLSWSNKSMVIFRILQALGGGMIMPIGMAIIYQIMPLEERGKAMGFWGIAALAAPAIGPTLGGYIIETMNWRLIFYINVPIGVIGVFLAIMLLENSEKQTGKVFDVIGFLSSTIGLVCILYELGEGSGIDWSKLETPILLIVGVTSLVIFVVQELTYSGEPLLDLRAFKIRNFTLGQTICAATTFVLVAGTYALPLFLQNIRGYTAMETGIIMFPSAIVTGLTMPIAGNISDKVGAKPLMIPGLLLLIGSSYALAFINTDFSRSTIVWLLAVRGLGLGLCAQVINVESLRKIPAEQTGMASALTNTIRQVAMSVGVAVMSTVITTHQNLNYARLSEQISEFNPVAFNFFKQLQNMYLWNGGYATDDAQSTARYAIYGMVNKQAYVDAMDYALAISVWVMIASLVLLFFMEGRGKDAAQPLEHSHAAPREEI